MSATANATVASLLSAAEQDDILKARLATDEKYLRRIAKRVTTLLQTSDENQQIAARSLLQGDLDMFFAHLERVHRIATTTAQSEIQEYRAEAQRLSGMRDEQLESIAQLKQDLKHAQTRQRERQEYDEIARKIIVYPRRDEMQAYVSRNSSSSLSLVKDQVDALHKENEAYAKVSSDTRQALEAVVEQLHSLTHTIQDTIGESQESTEPAEVTEKSSLNPQVASFHPTKRAHSHQLEGLEASKEGKPDLKRHRPNT
ncbi:hypothetical protein MPSI1_002413 [Malassezia psittaci]|uniref:Uncharacterized protein n=1 Tax=Malassezia psittaci TaxID=1821823 RepID=A0AAF0FB82_9BASI|nr:hypothetical protein MPSI1_002413 [Malassezia psittaci]